MGKEQLPYPDEVYLPPDTPPEIELTPERATETAPPWGPELPQE